MNGNELLGPSDSGVTVNRGRRRDVPQPGEWSGGKAAGRGLGGPMRKSKMALGLGKGCCVM